MNSLLSIRGRQKRNYLSRIKQVRGSSTSSTALMASQYYSLALDMAKEGQGPEKPLEAKNKL